MHDRDNSLRQLPTDPEKRSSPFGIWLQISEMLDKVIDYYRPGSRSADETGWEDDFLGFEEMVGDGEDKLDGPIMSELAFAKNPWRVTDTNRSPVPFPPHHVYGVTQISVYKRSCQVNTIIRSAESFGHSSHPSAQR